MKETTTHIYFWGDYLSNFYPCIFKDDQYTYNSSECYFMAKKAIIFNDNDALKKILELNDPKKQKGIGKKVKGFTNAVWDPIKYSIMIDALTLKFSQNPKLKKKLLETNDKILVEGSPYDGIWGVKLRFDDPLILDEKNWQGQNLLGKALMEVRSRLKNE